mgnify:CR=1 FL=1
MEEGRRWSTMDMDMLVDVCRQKLIKNKVILKDDADADSHTIKYLLSVHRNIVEHVLKRDVPSIYDLLIVHIVSTSHKVLGYEYILAIYRCRKVKSNE